MTPAATPSSDALTASEAVYAFCAGFAFTAALIASGWLFGRLARRYLT